MSAGLTVDDIASLLNVLGQTDAVLIGGQALQVWCDRYAPHIGALNAYAPFTSKDVDVQGDRRVLERCAATFSVTPRYPRTLEDATNVGFLELQLGTRCVGVNVLTSPYGIRASEANDTALTVSVGSQNLRVLHPVLCMESRLANVAGLGRTAARELRQARASILCARGFIAEVAKDHPRDALRLCERVFRYARKNLHARNAFRTHELDAFAAVDAYPGLPTAFASKRLPQMTQIIQSSRA